MFFAARTSSSPCRRLVEEHADDQQAGRGCADDDDLAKGATESRAASLGPRQPVRQQGVPALACSDQGIACSMSRTGNVWDNAAVESFLSSLKTERVSRKIYRTRDDARADVFDYIEQFYNPHRRHPTLDYESPIAFEAKMRVAQLSCSPSAPIGQFESAVNGGWQQSAVARRYVSSKSQMLCDDRQCPEWPRADRVSHQRNAAYREPLIQVENRDLPI